MTPAGVGARCLLRRKEWHPRGWARGPTSPLLFVDVQPDHLLPPRHSRIALRDHSFRVSMKMETTPRTPVLVSMPRWS